MARDKRGADAQEMMQATGRYMGLGLAWAMSVVFFLGIGWWLDTKLGTMPLLLVLGAFVGAGAGFYSLYYHIVTEPRQRENDSE